MFSSFALLDQLMTYFLFHQRWIFILFIIPASVVFNIIAGLNRRLILFIFASPKKHDKRVKYVQSQVKKWQNKHDDSKMCTGRAGWASSSLRQSNKHLRTKIDVDLNAILVIDRVKKTILVEPGVTIGQATDALLPLGFTLPVVPELEDLTIGGLINGVGLESSSHLYGLFKDTCVGFELVTADGELQKCSATSNVDLFYSIPGSHGTLGFLVAAELNIIPTKPFVKVEYLPTHSLDEAIRLLNESCTNKSYQFVEGLVFSETSAVIVRGRFSDLETDGKINSLSHWWKPWFYTYVRRVLKTGKSVEFVPVRDYYCRHKRSFFWMIADIIPFGNNRLFRYLLGWTSPPNSKLLKLTMSKTISLVYENSRLVQDMIVPMDVVEKTLVFAFRNLKIFPIWLCPYLCTNKPGLMHPSSQKDELYCNVGTYGDVGISDYHPIECTRAYESFVRRVHGFQMPYADSYQTRDEFAQMYDRTLYDNVRRKLPDCIRAFPDVFDKTTRAARY